MINKVVKDADIAVQDIKDGAVSDRALLEFLQSTYEAAAIAAKWDRDALECDQGQPRVVRQV